MRSDHPSNSRYGDIYYIYIYIYIYILYYVCIYYNQSLALNILDVIYVQEYRFPGINHK